MRRRKKYQILAPPVDYWFLLTIFLAIIFLSLLLLLIRERSFQRDAQVYLEKYRAYLNALTNINAQFLSSHLLKPTSPLSSSDMIYILPENFSYR